MCTLYTVRYSDQETVDMAFYLLETEGLFVGPSAALNVVGAVKAGKESLLMGTHSRPNASPCVSSISNLTKLAQRPSPQHPPACA